MDDPEKEYEWTRDWFKYADAQAYSANGWAITAAFAMFVYVMTNATDKPMVGFGAVASGFLILFTGLTSAGWARERDAAYRNLAALEEQLDLFIISQEPMGSVRKRRAKKKTIEMWRMDVTIYLLMIGILLGFYVGARYRLESLPPTRECTASLQSTRERVVLECPGASGTNSPASGTATPSESQK